MNSVDFVKQTIYVYNDDCIKELKEKFIGKYVFFNIINECSINKEIFSEKILDYIEKIELKTGNLFNEHLKKYINNLSSLVKSYLIDNSRARRYFDYASERIDTNDLNLEKLVDYTRIMLCLYSRIIEKEFKNIDNFDLSIKSIDLNIIFSAIENEKVPEVDFGVFNLGTKNKFNLEDKYSSDAFTFIMIVILYYYLINFKVRGDY